MQTCCWPYQPMIMIYNPKHISISSLKQSQVWEIVNKFTLISMTSKDKKCVCEISWRELMREMLRCERCVPVGPDAYWCSCISVSFSSNCSSSSSHLLLHEWIIPSVCNSKITLVSLLIQKFNLEFWCKLDKSQTCKFICSRKINLIPEQIETGISV